MMITTLRRMMLMNVLRRLLFIPAAFVVVCAWIIAVILLPITWPLVWILTGHNIFVTGATVMAWMEEQVGRILPE